jgi:hypothetical protein
MKLEFRTHWLRILVELFPDLPPIRRYRVAQADLDRRIRRLLRRRIGRQLGPREADTPS